MLKMRQRHSSVFMKFEKAGVKAKDYQQEGDLAFNSDENLKKRMKIRDKKEVKGWLSTFYHTFFVDESNPGAHAGEEEDIAREAVIR